MQMVLIYWLNTDNEIYYKFTRYRKPWFYVGYENSYGHIIIAMFKVQKGKFIQIEKSYCNKDKNKENKKTILIDKVIHFLEKLK